MFFLRVWQCYRAFSLYRLLPSFGCMQALGFGVGGDPEVFEQKLATLQAKKDSCERKLDVSRSVAASSRERAIKGSSIYQDIEEEHTKAKSELQILRSEIVEMNRHIAAIEGQCSQMEKGGGVSLWPKPALHPPMENDEFETPPLLQLHPCIFCNRGYPHYDIVVSSCKHIYHVFCAAAVARVDNKCIKCNEVFHPDWWQNFGFTGTSSQFEDEIGKFKLDSDPQDLKQLFKENDSHPIPNCKYHCNLLFVLYFCSFLNVLYSF